MADPADETHSLLAYYQHRVSAADAERQELLERVAACSGPTPAETYKLQAENRKRTDEVRELQKALSDAHTYLFEERERLLALQAENDSLRLQEVEDRARIKQLLSLTRPVEHKVVYGSENGPHSNAVFPRSSGGASGVGSSGSSRSPRRGARAGGAGGGSRESGVPPAGGPAPERILRTVYLPTAQGEALALRCEALQAQLAEQKRFAAERIAALQEDRAIRERDAAAAATALSATAEELAEKLRGAEEALRCTTRDYILARQQRDVAEEAAAAARAALQAQLAQRAEELLKFETVHKLLRSQLEARAADAERRAARASARARELQLRRAHEMEGWASDVGQLRKRIAAVERRLAQAALLQRLPDDERRDAVLARHARLLPGGSQAFDYECSLDDLVAELLCVKDSLLGMGERVRGAAQPAAAAQQHEGDEPLGESQDAG
ncbi:hypothetical protein CHLNCDRAFT_138772 [Chlorella variabilis]|uniref:Coiled-coil domain-containing 77 n=1 Tax=Chlorella variabilis TaxID=554065 RepID=E1ZNQ4_CHLVA|nr:hypothetical protein CHLNCDRAFT_138772 [Chlorella variabilis]EFN52358.1 hypothetical protein CHLNCDRAFT_138772 [Chlorella variabilis]|eukprot:XP_005844460.1 hypothetical protein CHLNCDRAFT_138772 [Chlorella variabilis]